MVLGKLPVPGRPLVGCFGFNGPFETIFQSISSRLPKKGRKRRKDR